MGRAGGVFSPLPDMRHARHLAAPRRATPLYRVFVYKVAIGMLVFEQALCVEEWGYRPRERVVNL